MDSVRWRWSCQSVLVWGRSCSNKGRVPVDVSPDLGVTWFFRVLCWRCLSELRRQERLGLVRVVPSLESLE